MGLESFYREAMTLNTIADMAQREAAAKAFFEKLNRTELPKTISGKIRRVELRETEEKKKQHQSVATHEYFYHQFPELRSKAR